MAPSQDSVPLDSRLQLSAVARDSLDNVVTGQPVTWATNNAGVARVSSDGLVTGVSQGTTMISATVGGVRAERSMRVIAVDSTATYRAAVLGHCAPRR